MLCWLALWFSVELGAMKRQGLQLEQSWKNFIMNSIKHGLEPNIGSISFYGSKEMLPLYEITQSSCYVLALMKMERSTWRPAVPICKAFCRLRAQSYPTSQFQCSHNAALTKGNKHSLRGLPPHRRMQHTSHRHCCH